MLRKVLSLEVSSVPGDLSIATFATAIVGAEASDLSVDDGRDAADLVELAAESAEDAMMRGKAKGTPQSDRSRRVMLSLLGSRRSARSLNRMLDELLSSSKALARIQASLHVHMLRHRVTHRQHVDPWALVRRRNAISIIIPIRNAHSFVDLKLNYTTESLFATPVCHAIRLVLCHLHRTIHSRSGSAMQP